MEPAEWLCAAITCEVTGDTEALDELVDEVEDPVRLLRLAVASSGFWGDRACAASGRGSGVVVAAGDLEGVGAVGGRGRWVRSWRTSRWTRSGCGDRPRTGPRWPLEGCCRLQGGRTMGGAGVSPKPWSLAETHCAVCGRPFVTEEVHARHWEVWANCTDHSCGDCRAYCWLCYGADCTPGDGDGRLGGLDIDEQIATAREALELIASTDSIEACLDPQRATRVAERALEDMK